MRIQVEHALFLVSLLFFVSNNSDLHAKVDGAPPLNLASGSHEAPSNWLIGDLSDGTVIEFVEPITIPSHIEGLEGYFLHGESAPRVVKLGHSSPPQCSFVFNSKVDRQTLLIPRRMTMGKPERSVEKVSPLPDGAMLYTINETIPISDERGTIKAIHCEMDVGPVKKADQFRFEIERSSQSDIPVAALTNAFGQSEHGVHVYLLKIQESNNSNGVSPAHFPRVGEPTPPSGKIVD